MKKALLLTLLSALMFSFGFSQTADRFWSPNTEVRSNIVKDKGVARLSFPKEFKLFDLNTESLRQDLFSIVGNSQKHSTVISLPNADGNYEQFEVHETSNFAPALQARFPEIRAYTGKGITDRGAILKLSISPQGIQTMVFRIEKADEFIEPYSKDHSTYAVFKSQRAKGQLPWVCSTPDQQLAQGLNAKVATSGFTGSSTGELKTMRLAQSCNGEYSNYFGATSSAQVALVLAAFNATLTRCNGCYEKDLAIHLNLVPETVNVIYYDPATDPYTTLGNWNTQLQIALNTSLTGPSTPLNVNNAAYDIGHMFGASGGGGNAGCIGCVCVDGVAAGTGATKGRGITSPADNIPQGDNFDIDYVAHEVGHQMGGNHTFSMSTEGTGVNKEVGSGITIMGYAGITSQDVAPHSIDIFHEATIAQIQANMAGKTCPVTTNITANNATPVVASVANATIPMQTPFALTGSATDANPNDVLTYCWEQDNDGTGQTGNNSVAYPAKPTGPNFLTFPATTSPTRLFPRLSTILAGLQVTPVLPGGDPVANIEALSSVSRTLNFRLTVRDNSSYVADPPASRKVGQTAFTDVVVTVTNAAGPFQVTQPNTNLSWPGGTTQTVTWDVNNTTAAPVSCANVRILLSTDGGTTFPTVLAASTANDGTESVTIPATPSATARIKVEAVGNIFFDISNTNFNITGAPTAPTVTINQAAAQADPTSTSPINFTVVFSEAVTGFATGDVTLSGTAGATTATVTGGPTTYNVAVSGMSASGTVIATIPASVCTSVASSLANTASTSTDNTVTFNLVAANPNVTINQAAAQADPTGVTPIAFTAVFDQPVTGFATGDVTLSGTAGATTATVVPVTTTTYTVNVTGMTGSGTVIATIAAGVAQNSTAQPNNASTSTDNTVTFNFPPGCTSVNPVPNDTVCNGATHAAVTFTSPTPGTTFSWVNNTPSIGLAASGTGNLPAFVATNATTAPVTATITVTPTLTVVTPTTSTFNFTGGAQTFTVPAGVSSINITALGAAGGAGAIGGANGGGPAGGAGGRGSRATGTLAVTPGQVLTIFVGGAGGTPTAGFNGGGTGGNANSGGGGGATDVRFPGASSADRIIVAGGGGGGGRGGCEGSVGAPGAGGAGGNGDGNGANGGDSPTGVGVAGGGFGAIGVVPGLQGIGCAGFLGAPGLANAGPAGGNGGAGQSCCCFNFASIPGGGGGGGGFLGGAGGGGGSAGTVLCAGNDKGAGGGGAGGTSFTGGVTAGAITTNIQTGNGQVVLNYNVTTICNGPTSTFTITVNPTATVNVVPNQTVCAGSPTTAVNFTSPTPNVIFNWTNNTPAIGLAATGTGNIPSFTALNPGTTPLVATVTVTPLIPVGGTVPGGPVTFTNTANIAIPGTGTGSGTGSAANPYPSNVTVTGVPTTGVSVRSVTLTNIQHTWSDDIGVLLVGPGGQKFVPMARVGGSGGFDAAATVTLRDGNPALPTGTAAIASGTYAPTAGTAGAIWPASAPAAPYSYPAPNGTATFANTFNTTSDYNGTWSLYVTDMAAGDVGNIAGGWGITLVTPAAPAVGCAGTPRTFTITVNPNPAIIVVADPGTTICEGDPTLLTVVTGTSTPSGVLYTQGNTPVNGSPSQVFEPANVAFNSQSADDFLVPAGTTWNITQMTANGIGAGAPTSVNVFFYNNSGSNLPGTAVATFNNVTTFTRVGGNYTVTLPSTVSLGGGRYWVSIQVNMAFASGGQWFWGNFGAPVLGNEYAFQNPGGGFATPCTNWGYAGSGCNVGGGAANVNSIFSLTGTSVVGGGPLGPGYTFLWSPAAGLSSTTSNPVAASPQNTTTYTVTATTPGGCTRTATVLITVNKRPVVTTQPASIARCVGTAASFTVGATGTGLTYQWQESATGCAGPWTNLTNGGIYSGATSPTLNINPVGATMNGYAYRCVVSGVCAPWTPPTNVSGCAVLTVNPLPVVTITPPISCGGVAGINGTQLSTASAPPPVPGSVSVSSGTINLAVPDNTANGVSNVIAMAGVPANATITNVSVTFNNFSHTYPGDMIIHLRAPNGAILNLYKYGTGLFTGPASGVPAWGWYGAKVSQTGTTAWSTVAAAPFIYNNSTPWKADAINTPVAGATIQNPTGFVSAATSFADLYTTPASTTGNWTLAMCDGGPGDVGTLGSWNLTIDYTTPGTTNSTLSYVWSPLTGLYNDAGATSPYTGANTPVVYAAPTVFTMYTVTATNTVTGCVNTASAFVNYTPPAPTVTPSSVTMCLGDPAVRLVSSSSSTTTSTVTATSGAISVAIPDGTGAAATSTLNIAGVPTGAGAAISEVKVTMNINHTWVGDVDVNLRAPNNAILNLVGGLDGGAGGNASDNFTNTAFSSIGVTPISGAAAPRTATYAAEGRAGYGPTGFIQTVGNWAGLIPNSAAANGAWTLAMGDFAGGDAGTLTSWTIAITSTVTTGVPSAPAVWTPAAGLFNDAAASSPYVAGTPRDTVWTRPTPAGVYTYQARVNSLPVPPVTFTNPAPITINAAGAASPYPSNLVVAGLPTTGVTVKNVTISGLSHTWSDDVDIVLQSPSGQNVILMSDIGNAGAFSGNNYTFDDAAPAMPPTAAAPPSGTYKPTNFVGLIGPEPDNWTAPGPGAVNQPAPALSTFTGNMNGTWKLFVFDDAAGDGGSISGGFSVGFNLGIAPCTSAPRTVVVTVNQPTTVATQPVNQTICTDKVATFTVVPAGTGPFSYQWQVSTDGGNTYSNISNGGVYSGATTATLTITAPPVSMSNYFYRVVVTGAAPCASVTSFQARLIVNPLPVVAITPVYSALFPGMTTTLTSTVTPNAASTYTWLRDGVQLTAGSQGVLSGIGTGTLRVDVDGLGLYTLRVTDVNGCTNTSNSAVVKDSASGRCFIYPNPTSGQFQVRYYSIAGNNNLPRGIVVYDAKGDRVFTQNYTVGRPYDRMDVDMRAYGKGLYWVEIVDRNGNRLTMCRVVVQ